MEYSDNSDGVHYVRHQSHCEGGCHVIVGCSELWENNKFGCLICEGAKRNVKVEDICKILDEHYLNEEVSDPRILPPLVPKYIELWDK